MNYYTKEWYELMQRQNYTLGIKKIPDRDYTAGDIQALYEKKRKQFIDEEKRCYNAPPICDTPDDFPTAGLFDGEDMQYIGELSKVEQAPKSAEEFSAFLVAQHEENLCRWERRPPFDPLETGHFFDEMIQSRCRYVLQGVPAWVAGQVDPRLLALDLMPERIYTRLHQEDLANRAAFRKIERQAEKVLSSHRSRLPREIVEGFRFHDGQVLRLQKQGPDYEMLLNVEGAGGFKPYMKVTFAGTTAIERESGIRLRVKEGQYDDFVSNCWYLYDELYAVPDGVEIHMLLNTSKLKYLTVRCRDIRFTPLETEDIKQVLQMGTKKDTL